jgi:hypothetical protein
MTGLVWCDGINPAPCWEEYIDGSVGSGRTEVDEWDVFEGDSGIYDNGGVTVVNSVGC